MAFEPAPGGTVKENGLIKLWFTDELPAFIAEGEQIHPMTGEVMVPGDRGGLNIDGYPNEPTLYVMPMAPTMGSGGAFYPWSRSGFSTITFHTAGRKRRFRCG